VQRIIRAYDEHKTKTAEEQMPLLESKSGTNGKANGNEPVIPDKTAISSAETESKE